MGGGDGGGRSGEWLERDGGVWMPLPMGNEEVGLTSAEFDGRGNF